MRILVAYATRYGATRGIAERIAARLAMEGHAADAKPVGSDLDVDGYDAFVVGGAAYYGRWMKEVHRFADRHAAVLASHPTWFFSSGPLGPDQLDAKGRDPKTMTIPTDFGEFREAIHPRGERVFFGAFDSAKLPLMMKAIRLMPAAREILPRGDYRDWADIEAWATEIADSLVTALV